MTDNNAQVINAAFYEKISEVILDYLKYINFYELLTNPAPFNGVIDKQIIAKSFTDNILEALNANLEDEILSILENTVAIQIKVDLDKF